MENFEELMAPQGEYRLDDVSIAVIDEAIQFKGRLLGPPDADVWARAWVSDNTRTLAETASPKSVAGESVTIIVSAPPSLMGCTAFFRIESQPLETEHILCFPLG